MPDNQLSFETRVDLSGLETGVAGIDTRMKSAASSVEDFNRRAAAAQDAYNQQAARGYKIQEQLGKAFDAASASGASYVEAMESAAAATRDVGVASEKTSTSIRNVTGNMYAAQGAAGLLEGRLPIRAFERFITTIPGVGAALQLAFPIVGAIALGEIVVDLGKKLYDAFDLGGERARKTADDIRSVTNELNTSNTALDVQIDKLQQEEAKLEKKPFNGIKLVLDEAAQAAQNLSDKLDGVIKKEEEAVKSMSASIPQRLLGGSQTGYEQTMLQQHAKWLGQAKNEQDQLNESVSFGNSLNQRLAELQQKQRDSAESSQLALQQGTAVNVTDYSNEINAVKQLISWHQQEQAEIQKNIDLNKQQGATQNARDHADDAGLANKADTARLKAMEVARDLEKQEGLITIKNDHDFWAARINEFTAGSEQFKTVMDKITQDDVEGARKASEAIAKLKSSQLRSANNPDVLIAGQQAIDTWLLKTADDATHSGDAWKAYNAELLKSFEINTQNAAALQEANLATDVAEGSVTRVSAAHQLAAIHAEEYRAKLKALEDELRSLQAASANLHPGDKDYAQNQTQIQGIRNQIAQVQGQGAVTGVKDASATTQAIASPYLNAFGQINQGFLQVQSKMILGTQSISRDFAQMGANLVVSVAGAWEKMLAKQIASEIQMQAAHAATAQAGVAITATTQAESTAIHKSNLIEQAFGDAKAAAVKAFKWGMDLPFPVDLAVAPALAAGAFAGALSLAAFETGGIIPNTGIALVHQGEAVIPAGLTNLLLNASSNTNNNSSSASVTNNFNGGSDAQFRRQMSRNADHVVNTVQRGMRRKGLS